MYEVKNIVEVMTAFHLSTYLLQLVENQGKRYIILILIIICVSLILWLGIKKTASYQPT